MRYLGLIPLIACVGNGKSTSEQGLLADSDRPVWSPDPQAISNSSSSSTIAWTPPESNEELMRPAYYDVVVRSEFDRTEFEGRVTQPELELESLRTDTEYEIELVACYDEECIDRLERESTMPNVWRTEVEQWRIAGLDGTQFTPLMPNTHSPSLINLSALPIGETGWVLATLSDSGAYRSVEISHLQDIFCSPSGDDVELEITSSNSGGIADFPGLLTLTSASVRPIKRDGNWTMQLLVSAEVDNAERSMIGSWNAQDGFEGSNTFNTGYGVCEIDVVTDTCGMNTCIDSDNGELSFIDCISILKGASPEQDLMLIQGLQDSGDTSPPNLYLAEPNEDDSWSPVTTDSGPLAAALLKNATRASVWTEDNHSKLYYRDEVSGTTKLRYWDPSSTGDTERLEINDIEGEDRIRNVSYKDVNGDPISSDFQIIEQTFLRVRGNPYMLTTIMDTEGRKHMTLGILTNP